MDDIYESDERDGSDTYVDVDSRHQRPSQPAGQTAKNAAREDGPACLPCRRKKSKCSRSLPCSQCVKYNHNCTYNDTRAKPGMRPGAIESLTQRLTTLENMFLGQGVLWQQVWKCLDNIETSMQDKIPPSIHPTQHTPASTTLRQSSAQLRELLAGLSYPNGNEDGAPDQDDDAVPSGRPAKRQRLDPHASIQSSNPLTGLSNIVDSRTGLGLGLDSPLPDDLTESLITIYFSRIHPWIPMLHVIRFRADFKNLALRPKLATILLAIKSICARFSDDPRLGNSEEKAALAKAYRRRVILLSMESFSVENLQAMIIIAFDMIGSGRGPSAWSIIGSMTRTVEQLQLSVEDKASSSSSGNDTRSLVQRIDFLPPCRDWVEMEERRRVFWNTFLMDRFCSVVTGWNVSLTSADVKRRLPCEGALWENGMPLDIPTPFFGVSEKSQRIHDPLPSARSEQIDAESQESIGGFAYCIEATESLSLVTSFFLQQAIDVTRVRELQVWLMRFKQLDLRLVQWKIFLPERWREACARNAEGNMDPNLTLAHVTHNTAVVLLHQSLAYPSPEWQSVPVNLPSSSNAEICFAAAKEVAIITDNFLRHRDIIIPPQFSFCLFVCGRMLITHAAYSGTPVADEFHTIVEALHSIARKWNGIHPGSQTSFTDDLKQAQAPPSSNSLASKFASRLFKDKDLVPSVGDIRHAVYADVQDQQLSEQIQEDGYISSDLKPGQAQAPSTAGQWAASQPQSQLHHESSPDSISMAFPPLPYSLQIAIPERSPGRTNGGGMDPHAGSISGYAIGGAMSGTADDQAFEPSNESFEALNSYLHSSYPANERISVFSEMNLGGP